MLSVLLLVLEFATVALYSGSWTVSQIVGVEVVFEMAAPWACTSEFSFL